MMRNSVVAGISILGLLSLVFIVHTQPASAEAFNVFKAGNSKWMRDKLADWAMSLPDRREAGFVVWALPTWGPVLQAEEQSLPDPADIGRPVRLRAVVNEKQYALVALTNLQGNPLDVEVTVQPVLTGPGGSVEKSRVDVRVIGTILSRRYGEVIGPLFSVEDIVGIKSAALPPAGRRIDWYLVKAPSYIRNWKNISRFPLISLSPYGTVLLWLTLDTTDLSAGTYETALQVTAVPGGQSQQVPIRLEVLPIVLPARSNLKIIVWDTPPGDPGLTSAYLKDLRAHGVSVFFRDLSTPVALEEGERILVNSGSFWTSAAGKWISPEQAAEWKARDPSGFEEAIRKAVRSLAHQAEQRGFSFEQWWLEIWDEPQDGMATIWAEVAHIVKAEEPRILLVANPAAHWEQASVTLDGTFRRLAPYVDVWWPFHTHLTAEGGAHLAFVKGTGKPVGYYDTPGIFVSRAETAGYGFYRKAAWRAFRYDLQGIGFWAYNSYYGNPWDDTDADVVDWPDAAVVYPGPWGPIPSRNWEAFRDGLDDYRILRLLAEEAVKAQEKAESRRQGLYEALMELAVQMDQASSAAEVERLRERLYDLVADWVNR